MHKIAPLFMGSMHTRQLTARWRTVMGKDKMMEGI